MSQLRSYHVYFSYIDVYPAFTSCIRQHLSLLFPFLVICYSFISRVTVYVISFTDWFTFSSFIFIPVTFYITFSCSVLLSGVFILHLSLAFSLLTGILWFYIIMSSNGLMTYWFYHLMVYFGSLFLPYLCILGLLCYRFGCD